MIVTVEDVQLIKKAKIRLTINPVLLALPSSVPQIMILNSERIEVPPREWSAEALIAAPLFLSSLSITTIKPEDTVSISITPDFVVFSTISAIPVKIKLRTQEINPVSIVCTESQTHRFKFKYLTKLLKIAKISKSTV